MSKRHKLALVCVALMAATAGYITIHAEHAIEQRRDARTGKTDYWICRNLPADEVLRRMFVQRMLTTSNHTNLGRALEFWGFYAYVSIRINRTELVEDFLKTASKREIGCLKLVGDFK